MNLFNEKGPKSIDFAIWWDGDLIRELLDHEFDDEKAVGYPKIYKWDYENNKLVTILDPKGTLSNNWKKGTPCIQADILGDWREEAVWRNEDDTETSYLHNNKLQITSSICLCTTVFTD